MSINPYSMMIAKAICHDDGMRKKASNTRTDEDKYTALLCGIVKTAQQGAQAPGVQQPSPAGPPQQRLGFMDHVMDFLRNIFGGFGTKARAQQRQNWIDWKAQSLADRNNVTAPQNKWYKPNWFLRGQQKRYDKKMQGFRNAATDMWDMGAGRY